MMLEFGRSPAQQPPLTASRSHIGARLALCDGVPKLLNDVLLEVDSSLHEIQVHYLGTRVQLIMKHEKHCSNFDRTTDEIFHFLCIHLQVFLYGNLS